MESGIAGNPKYLLPNFIKNSKSSTQYLEIGKIINVANKIIDSIAADNNKPPSATSQ